MNISCPPVYVFEPYNEELGHYDQILKIVTSSVQVALVVPTILSNALIFWTILKTKSLRTPSFILICSLACTDIGAGLITSSLNSYWKIIELTEKSANICSNFDVFFATGFAFFSASEFTVTALCIDRYLAIRWGLLYRHRVTNSRAIKVVFFLWSVAIVWSVTSVLIKPRVLHGTVIIVGVATFGAIFLCCTLSLKALFEIEKKTFLGRTQVRPTGKVPKRKEENDPEHQTGREEGKFTDERPLELSTNRLFSDSKENSTPNPKCVTPKFKLAKYRYTMLTLFLIVVLLVLCYAPYFLLSFAVVAIGMTDEVVVAWSVTITGLCINSFLNPLVYFWRFRELRKECLKTLKKLC